jgi:hypothetical protein
MYRNLWASWLKFEAFIMLLDQRRIGRTTVVQPAKIVAIDADTMRDCIVDNLTTFGECGSAADLPDIFDITFDNWCTIWSCRVICRNKNCGRVGVIGMLIALRPRQLIRVRVQKLSCDTDATA